ncbi:hypothetical protein K461DRAFT_290516 [Myriangium duriaei CBS 260.36]|uniref:Rhodopsin domain-containing protein n=1 Tax=Myriangium duriaei CBS 260.36 TaxID=1168546 RepID=A0A9P4JES2_9PEZI|nr:hypothetical protein K461DRAFT_290516 [Myriangium duriaei CBS 260.36]
MPPVENNNPYHNNYASIIAVDAMCAFVSIICISTRLYVRRVLIGKVALDDWLLLAGVIVYVASTFNDGTAWVKRMKEGVYPGPDPGYLIEVVAVFPYLLAEVLVRAAYLAFYLNITPPELDTWWSRWTLKITFGIYAIFEMSVAFIYVFQCGYPGNIGNSDVPCVDATALGVLFDMSYGFDAAFDWLMALIPMRVVYKSTLNKRTKRSVMAILLLGCCASVLAVAVIPLSHFEGIFSATNEYDMHLGIDIDIVATCEALVAIICLSLAACKSLFRSWLDGEPTEYNGVSDASTLPKPLALQLEALDSQNTDQKRG